MHALFRPPAKGPHQSTTLMGPKAGAQAALPRRFFVLDWTPAFAGVLAS
jgi:hypothetical protein